jgi:hypothetical protein
VRQPQELFGPFVEAELRGGSFQLAPCSLPEPRVEPAAPTKGPAGIWSRAIGSRPDAAPGQPVPESQAAAVERDTLQADGPGDVVPVEPQHPAGIPFDFCDDTFYGLAAEVEDRLTEAVVAAPDRGPLFFSIVAKKKLRPLPE